ncbi:hypothetical protein V2J09_022869 [Rumex salicifolius]
MSSVYVLEPPTKGKIVINTTYGPIDIELWAKEAPKAVRNFVQLCLEGYYDNTIFHRVIKGFLVQGGDPTGTGSGGESIYGGAFSDEFHSRLRFNHRGLLACANAGTPHSNGSQFFISLDRCDWIDKKNTIFGKVTGHSLYNLLRLGEVETDKDDRPLDPPPKIMSAEVLWNPFEDIVPRGLTQNSAEQVSGTDNKDAKKKGVKKLSLLSFGEEAEQEEKELAAVKQKIKSSHDVLDDPRLLKGDTSIEDMNSEKAQQARDLKLSIRETLTVKKGQSQESIADLPVDHRQGDSDDGDDNEMSFDARMREQILRKRKEMGDSTAKRPMPPRVTENSKSKDVEKLNSRSDSDDGDKRSKAKKLSINKKQVGSEARAERLANTDTDLELLNTREQARLMQKQKKRRLQGREDEALAKLERMKQLLNKKSATSKETEDKNNEDNSPWFRAKFAPVTVKDKSDPTPNDYVVHDPLLEKGKEKFNKLIAKQKRREREWAGRSLT